MQSHHINLDVEDVEDLFQTLDMLASVVARLDAGDGSEAACFVHAMTQRLRAKHDLGEGPTPC